MTCQHVDLQWYMYTWFLLFTWIYLLRFSTCQPADTIHYGARSVRFENWFEMMWTSIFLTLPQSLNKKTPQWFIWSRLSFYSQVEHPWLVLLSMLYWRLISKWLVNVMCWKANVLNVVVFWCSKCLSIATMHRSSEQFDFFDGNSWMMCSLNNTLSFNLSFKNDNKSTIHNFTKR